VIARLLISTSLEKRVEEINKILSSHKEHPDLLYFSKDAKLGIEQARKIKEYFSLKPYSDKGPVVVLEDASSLTAEAQNALLKTLEELPTEALFILGANSDAKFLPTILSRCQVERLQGTGDRQQEDYKEDIEKLIQSSLAERFEFIEKLKDKEGFIKSMVNYFYQSRNMKFLEELLQAEEWAEQNVNTRAILEYLMLVMPHRL